MHRQGLWQIGWQVTRTVLAILAVVAFASVTTFELIGWSLNQALENPVTYTRMIQQTNLVSEGRVYIVGVFARIVAVNAQALPLFNQVPQEGWQAVTELLLPEPWVEGTVNNIVLSMAAWMKNKDQALPEITIDLKPVQDDLRSQQGEMAVQLLIQYLPTCSGSQGLLGLLNFLQLKCIPQGVDLTPIAPLITSAFANLLPAQIVVSSSTQAGIFSPQVAGGIVKLHAAYQLMAPGLSLGLRLSLFFLSAYALLTSGSSRRLLRASPLPFYAAGILSMTLIFFGSLFFRLFLSWVFSILSPQGAVDMSTLLVNGLLSIIGTIGRPWLGWATGILSLGIVLHLLSLRIELNQRRRHPSPEENDIIDESSHADHGGSPAPAG